MEESCMVCLDPLKENPTSNPFGCSCKILAHEACLRSWFHQKQKLECPICHTVITQNPVVIYIQPPRQEEEERRVYRRNEKAIAMCCCILLGWAISLSILEFVFQK
jgi:hypothetical protein